MRLLLPVLLLASAAACSRQVGWFRADRQPSREDLYDERFEAIVMAPEGPCDPVRARLGDAPAPIIVLVPGVGGDGEEMRASVPALMKAKPASMFMFRYDPFWQVGELSDLLASGLNRLSECVPEGAGRIIVLAHSGGGLISSFAVAKVKPPKDVEGGAGNWLTLLTVASPLAGTGRIPVIKPVEKQRLMRVLGMNNDEPFPEPAKGVRVVHLRSSAQSDGYMRPAGEHLPNDPNVGSPGAPQYDLPVELDHGQALVYVAKKVGDGSYTEWLK